MCCRQDVTRSATCKMCCKLQQKVEALPTFFATCNTAEKYIPSSRSVFSCCKLQQKSHCVTSPVGC